MAIIQKVNTLLAFNTSITILYVTLLYEEIIIVRLFFPVLDMKTI